MFRQQQIRTVMPEHYLTDDENWIQEQLLQLDPTTRVKIARKYAEAYLEAWDKEPVPFRKDNKARRNANTRLRVYVQKYARASRGYTLPPVAVQK
ncbi:hypothetical protein ITL57_001628 [Salmonella enterica]|nr:hypothetical protein [Salmonella enterica]EFQ9125250.1 hypothetical protein [Salmonella enterica]EGK0217622.1 hypothetical protein [Salmonella enterica]EGO1196925.1 hypothetical protein [Salmonella enterica]EGT8766722.1 hypothetical protein [Salmonella enterica]